LHPPVSSFFSRTIILKKIIDKDFDTTSSSDEDDEDRLSEYSSMDTNEEDRMETKGPVEDSSTGFIVFRCNDPQCIKWYRSIVRCEDHIATGQHVYPEVKLSLVDTAVTQYKIKTDQIHLHTNLTSTTNFASLPGSSSPYLLTEGWALIQSKSTKRFSPDQIAFLVEKYDEGEKSGNKWNPAAVVAVSILLDLLLKTLVV
jgi:preprotein translocase subunit Sec61beta